MAVLRKGMFAKILVSQALSVTSASGYPQENDVLLLGTNSFFEDLSDGQLKAALEAGKTEDAFEILSPQIHSKKLGDVGAVILKFSKEKMFAMDKEKIEEKQDKQKIIETASNFFKPFVLGLKRAGSFLTKKLPQRKIYLKGKPVEEFTEKKKTTLSVGTILLILLVVSIGFGIRQKTIKDRKSGYKDRLDEANHKYNQALSLFEVELVRAREIFREAYTIAIQLKEEGIKDSEVDGLVENIEANKGEILGEYHKEALLFRDLSLISSGFLGDELSYSLGKLYVLDKNSKKVASILVDSKKTEVVAGPDKLGEVNSFSAYEDSVYVLENDGIYKVDKNRKKVIDKDWEGDVVVKAYAGNIYMLEKAANMIWRYVGVEEGFSSKQKWLAPGVEPDFSLIDKMSIDGLIWITTSSNKILKFSHGSPQNFSISGEYPNLTQIDGFYTNEELKNVYVLDKDKKRIAVFDKEAKFQAQYFSEALAEAKDYVVSEKEKKIIFLTGDRLYSLDIQ